MTLFKKENSYFFASLAVHLAILLVFIGSFQMMSTLPVIQQSNDKQNSIQASVVTDLSKLAPTSPSKTAPPPQVQPQLEKTIEKSKPLPERITKVQDDAIPILKKKKKIIELKKPVFKPDDLLTDLKKQVNDKKKTKQKSLQSVFAKSLEQQLAREKINSDATKTLQMQGVIDKYKALILQSISQHWLVPPTADKHMSSELLIRLAPGGAVLDVQLVKSSGDTALDRSARAAVFKASPLPVPANTNEFEPFRQFVLKVKPEDIQGI